MTKRKKLLSCWHKLEHFSPATLPKGNNIQEFDLRKKELWKIPLVPNHSRKTIEYTIYLGVFESSNITKFVKEFFKTDKEEENARSSKICFASLNLDIEGKYIDKTFGISTLPWALAQLENKKISSNSWGNQFNEIKDELENYIERHFKEVITNEKNEIVRIATVVKNEQLTVLENKIIELSDWSVRPETAMYVNITEKFVSNKKKADTDILNSFYVRDLENIIKNYTKKSSPPAFENYLNGSLNVLPERIDLRQNAQILKASLQPKEFPDGCWPADFSLNLMQQYAVNNIFNTLADKEGLLSVNGPPGTGKTTLLRDLIAPIIVKKAKALSKIKKPWEAFSRVGEIAITETYKAYLYAPKSAITQAGIVVASSNNGAVENISKELPMKSAVGQYANQVEYFRQAAENCQGEDNWGLISAVLGNKQNRTNFVNKLWYDFDEAQIIGLQKALLRYDRQPTQGIAAWQTVVKNFNKKLAEVNAEKQKLENFRQEYQKFVKHVKEQNNYLRLERQSSDSLNQIQIKLDKQNMLVNDLDQKKEKVLAELSLIQNSKPNFFTYWLSSKIRNSYQQSLATILEEYRLIKERTAAEAETLKELNESFAKAITAHHHRKAKLDEANQNLKEITPKIELAKTYLKNNYADIKYWNQVESKQSQVACPWYSQNLKKLQVELFIAALQLNETFILAANAQSKRITTTLHGFFEYLKGNIQASSLEIKAMWDTFFLIIPVVSTTFASVQTMFKGMGKGSIPWLFIDEAGQAVPQSAAGAIWRSKRVVVVGDPFQIEPVVTIPQLITDNISQYFELNHQHISTELSVQSMADRSNPFGSYLENKDKKEWIGMPLRVHRRCLNPMFDIANRIAYDKLMYFATPAPAGIAVNFKTSFVHCTGKVEGRHFIPEQAELIKNILHKEITIFRKLPDVFIITPFNEISYKLNGYLFQPLLKTINQYQKTSGKEMGDWLKKHVGTVHTFQGKQAEGVILCLGLDKQTQGAANWAAQKPNLLNVAITRSKYRFMAIGDGNIWLNHPYFSELKQLPQFTC